MYGMTFPGAHHRARRLSTERDEHASYNAENIASEYDWHHAHNLDLLSTSYQYVGQMKTAERLMREAIAMAAVSDNREFNKKEWPSFLLARGRTEEALRAAGELTAGKYPAGRAIGQVLTGHAFLALNRMNEARAALTAAEKEMQSVPRLAPGVSVGARALQPYGRAASGKPAAVSAKMEEGARFSKSVIRRLRALPGPACLEPGAFRLEMIAQTAREVGDWELAEYTARQACSSMTLATRVPHYALALVARAESRQKRSRKRIRRSGKILAQADPDPLPELARARAKTASSGK